MRSIRVHIAVPLLLVLWWGSIYPSLGQNDFESVEDLRDKAEELFEERKFVKAMPLYSQLLSHKPEDPIYNYKYGVCALHGQADKEKPLKHLEYAAKKKEVPPPVHYYLGRTYHRNYRFGEAIEAYQRFKTKGDPDELPVQRQLRMAKSGRSLMENPNELVVMDKTRTGTDEFFRYYEPQGVNGQILVAPEDILHEADKERDARSIIFFPSGSKTIYYSSYGEDGEQKDLYKVKQLPNGEWAKPQKLKGAVNTEFDEDYPFKAPQSKDLYFCSKGHNSMGGYDIFRSEFDPKNNSYGEPENLDYPINSPDDDLLYLADDENNIAYFASGRSSDAEHLHVYKVRIEKIPMRTAILKGKFRNRIDSSQRKAEIIVKNASTNTKVGVFNSSSKNGDYLITVPKSGKYKFLVRPASSEYEHEATVDVPQLEEIRPLKQALILKRANGKEKLVIKNKFDERFENEGAILSQVMKEKGELDVNDSEAMREKLQEAKKAEEAQEKADSADAEAGKALVEAAKEEAGTLEEKAEKNEARSAEAFSKAKEAQGSAENASAKADSLLEKAEASSDPEVKEKALEKADSLQELATRKAQEAQSAYELGESLDERADKQRGAAKKARDYANELASTLDNTSKEEALEKVSEQKEAWTAAKKEAEQSSTNPASLREEAETLEQKADEKLEEGQSERQRARELEDRIASIDRRIPQASGQEKEELRQERKELRSELEQARASADSAFAQADAIQEEAERRSKRADLLARMEEEGGTGSPSASEDWDPSAKDELRTALEETQKANRERAQTPLLAQHRSEGRKSGERESSNARSSSTTDEAGTEGEEGRDKESPPTASSSESGEADPESFRFEEADPQVREEVGTADPSYERDVQRIRENEELSPRERKERVRQRKRELAKKIEDRIEKQQRELDRTEDPQEKEAIEKEVQRLRKAKEQLDQDVGRKGAEDLAGTESDAGSSGSGRSEGGSRGSPSSESGEADPESFRFEEADPQVREEVGTADPSYERDVQRIRENEELSSRERKERVRQRKRELAKKIEDRIEEQQGELDRTEDPQEKEAIEKEVQRLRKAKEQLDQDVGRKASDDEVEAGTEKRIFDFEEADERTREELEALDPEYNTDVQELKKDTSLSQSERTARIQERQRSLAERVNEGIQEKERELEEGELDPEEREELQQEIEALEEARSQLPAPGKTMADAGNEERTDEGSGTKEGTETPTEAGSDTDTASGSASERSGTSREKRSLRSELGSAERALLDQEAPSYDQDIEAIENSDRSRVEKDLARAERTETLVNQLEERIAEEREKLSRSNDPEALRKSSEELERLRSLRDKKEKEAARFRARAAGDEPQIAQSSDAGPGSSSDAEEGEDPPREGDEKGEEGRREEGAPSEKTGSKRKESESGSVRRDVPESIDPSYRSDMEAIDNEADPSERSYYQRKAEREKTARERISTAIDSTRKALENAEDPEERRELSKRLERLERSRNASRERDQRFQAYANQDNETPDPAERIQNSYQADRDALSESELPEERSEKLQEERRERTLARVENAIRKEERVRDKAGKGPVKRQAQKRIRKLKRFKKELSKEGEGSDEKAPSQARDPEQEARKRAQAIVVDEGDGTGDEEGSERKELAGKKAQEAARFADQKRMEAMELRNEIQESEDEDSDEEKRRKRVQAMVLQQKADSAQRMARAFERMSDKEEEELEGEVLAVQGGNEGTEEGDEKGETASGTEDPGRGSNEDNAQGSDESTEEGSEGGAPTTESNSSDEGTQEGEGRSPDEGGNENPTKDEAGASTGSGTAEKSETDSDTGSGTASPGEGERESPEARALSQEVLSMEDPGTIEKSGNLFAETEGSPYSGSNPIPKDPEMPDGVFYQVQVGAFRSSIPQDHFKGFAPLIGKTGDDGITRYRAGFFKDRAEAERAKERIQQKGYSDAFVVAYDGGERIAVSQADARTESSEGGAESSGTEAGSRTRSGGTSGPASGSIDRIDGLFYTVQVGVYSDPLRNAGPLRGIDPLYVKQTRNGNYRYSTGIFKTVEEAREKEQRVKAEGISDAFITAYRDGERITVGKAEELVRSQGRGILHGEEAETSPGREKETSDDQEGNSQGSPDEKESTDADEAEKSEGESELTPADIEIKVDLGTYEDQVPNKVARVILKSSGEGIKERKNDEGHTNFRTKAYPTFEAANRIRRKFVKEGIEQAEIITLANGEPIPRERAERILQE